MPHAYNPQPKKSQDAAFRDARKPQPKPKSPAPPRNTATGSRISKNKGRNERRKTARKTAMLLKSQGITSGREAKAAVKEEEGSERMEEGQGLEEKMAVDEEGTKAGSGEE